MILRTAKLLKKQGEYYKLHAYSESETICGVKINDKWNTFGPDETDLKLITCDKCRRKINKTLPAKNKIEIMGDITILFLEKRNGEVFECLIDTCDLPIVGCYRWGYRGGYAVRGIREVDGTVTTVRLHRYLTNAPDELDVDHIDNNPLNNCKENLRLATASENMQNRAGVTKANSSGVRGVTWRAERGKWHAHLAVGGKKYTIGNFSTLTEAETAVKEARSRLLPFSKEGTEAAKQVPSKSDSPYLDASSNGLVYVADRFKNETLSGHLLLRNSERSRLAERAAELL
jgi:hypothetical protein